MDEDKIISVLLGLIGACNNNPKTEVTDELIIKSLASPLIYPNLGDDKILELIEVKQWGGESSPQPYLLFLFFVLCDAIFET